ncbi:MAG: carbohydrate-binding family 9-like protein [Verrucomicrobiae bacterium]|nr:carbohydrate-binding family 9-like protein [Verrucomicrobiae bacterium]
MKKLLPRFVTLFTLLVLLEGCRNHQDPTDPMGRTLKSVKVPYTTSPVTIDGKLNEAAWKTAAEVDDFVFPWWEAGEKEATKARLTWDDQYLYVAFICEDTHIWAVHKERDSPVYQDDCVEVFAAPNPENLKNYYNVEMNAIGAHLDFHHPEGPGGKVEWNPAVKIATSIEGTLNDDSDQDTRWILEAALPFADYRAAAVNVPPQLGDEWRVNLHRLGGETNAQMSMWSPGDPANKAFHTPPFFGRIIFEK